MNAETGPPDESGKVQYSGEQPLAQPVSKQALLEQIRSATAAGDIQDDGSRETTVPLPVDRAHKFGGELHITWCLPGELSIDDRHDQVALVYYYIRSRAARETDPIYYVYHLIDEPAELKIVKTKGDISEEEPAGYISLQQAVTDWRQQYRYLYDQSEPVTEAEVQQLLGLLQDYAE